MMYYMFLFLKELFASENDKLFYRLKQHNSHIWKT